MRVYGTRVFFEEKQAAGAPPLPMRLINAILQHRLGERSVADHDQHRAEEERQRRELQALVAMELAQTNGRMRYARPPLILAAGAVPPVDPGVDSFGFAPLMSGSNVPVGLDQGMVRMASQAIGSGAEILQLEKDAGIMSALARGPAGQMLGGVGRGIAGLGKGVGGGVASLVGGTAKGIAAVPGRVAGAVSSGANAAGGGVASAFRNASNAVGQGMVNAGQRAEQALSNVGQRAQAGMSGVGAKAQAALSGKPSALRAPAMKPPTPAALGQPAPSATPPPIAARAPAKPPTPANPPTGTPYRGPPAGATKPPPLPAAQTGAAPQGQPGTLQRLGQDLGGGKWKWKLPMLAAGAAGTYGAYKGLQKGIEYMSGEAHPYKFNQGAPQMAYGVNEYGYPQLGTPLQ